MEDVSGFEVERLRKRVKELEAERDHLLKIFLEADLGIDSIKKVELIMGGSDE